MNQGNVLGTNRSVRRSSCLWLAAVGLLALTPPYASAQNAAQRAALARLARPRPQNSQPGGVEATTLPLVTPNGVAFDSAGNLFIADTGDNLVREINTAGIINTVAGTGEQGFGGDGGAATSALLDSPTGVAVDANGNIYIADTHNNRIREVSAGGTINTIAGTGTAGYGGDGGASASAALANPSAIVVDANGNLFIADTGNNRIREISVSGTISTVAGNGVQGFAGDGGAATSANLDSPDGVAVDANGNIYIGDTHNQRVRVVTASGTISTLAGTGAKTFNGDGTANTTALASPSGVAVDSGGNVYVADSDNNRIRTIAGGNVATIAGNGNEGFTASGSASTSSSLDTPRAVVVNGTAVTFSDTLNNSVDTVVGNTLTTVGGIPGSHSESLILSGPTTTIYGTGVLTATFSNSGATGTGLVTFYDGQGASPVTIGSASLTGNAAAINTAALAAGTHYIYAAYAGDSKNAAISSGVYVYIVTPAQLSAVANSVSLLYGQAIPALSGTLTGVLAQDNGNVTAVFSTTATSTSAPASYPITVALAGTAASNYTVSLGSGSGFVTIAQAPTTTTLQVSSATPILGTQFTLTATVASTTTGTPAGTVNFFDGTAYGPTPLNASPVPLIGGIATFTTTSLPVGAANLTAVYSGNVDYVTSTSALTSISVLSPDFTIATSPSTQAVVPGQSVNYALTLTPANPTFVYPVTLTASNLPNGVTATFAPSSIATGAGTTNVTLTLNASSQAKLQQERNPFSRAGSSAVLAFLFLPLVFNKRFRRNCARLSGKARLLIVLLALVVLTAISGCGGGGYFGHPKENYSVTVTAVSGPNTRTSTVTLTVQ